MQGSTAASGTAVEAGDPFSVGASVSPAKNVAQEQQAQQAAADPFAPTPSSSSPVPRGRPAAGLQATQATPPKKSAADILKMFDSPHGQVC